MLQVKSPRSIAQRIFFNAYSVWLFTASDIKTVILPSTLFALVSATSADIFGVEEDPLSTPRSSVTRTILAATWTWINLLPFAIDNQRQDDAVHEDSLNKPWRTLPSKRMTIGQARILMLTLYPLSLLVSRILGALLPSTVLLLLGVWYNDLHGADASCILRNCINACGILCFISGAFQAAMQVHVIRNKVVQEWMCVIGSIIFSSIQAQDMPDQAGDRARGRKTLPLVVGDSPARWTVALPVLFWSVFCPHFWRLSNFGYAAPCALGTAIAMRILLRRTKAEDKATFRLWNLWLVCIYTLPLQVSWLRGGDRL